MAKHTARLKVQHRSQRRGRFVPLPAWLCFVVSKTDKQRLFLFFINILNFY